MQKVIRLKAVLGAVALLAACSADAATFLRTFPELDGPPSSAQDPFPPQPSLNVGTVTFPVPVGERVIAATVSGYWGTSTIPEEGTAGVNVLVDGILVAKCVKPSPGCWGNSSGQRPWNYIFAASELAALNDGVATMTAVQTSDITVRLGTSTLIVETGPVPPVPPVPTVPALSALGLLALVAGMAAAGVFLVRRDSA
jgi:hypothetical protein